MRKNRIKDSEWIFSGQNRGKLVKISFLAEGGFFSQKKWGTNKIEYVCICHGHPWVSGQNSIPTLTNYPPPPNYAVTRVRIHQSFNWRTEPVVS